MPVLEVLHFTGDVSRHELSKGQPLTIGSHSTNDIIIDDDTVELMHCRVSWSKAGFEAVAAGVDGVDVNGTVVQRAVLKSGDTLRFGSVDIRFADEDGSPAAEARPAREQAKASPPAVPKSRKPAPVEEDDDSTLADSSGGGWNALEALASEARSPAKPEKPKKQAIPQAIEPDTLEEIDDPDAEDAIPSAVMAEDAEPEEPKLRDRLRTAVRSQNHRPGQEDTLRSPLILGLAGAGALLVLLGGIFFFIAGRQDAEAAFNDAKAQYDQAKYPQAIELLTKFLETYEGNPLEEDARRMLALSQVDQFIRGAAKKWPEGIESLRSFINLRQNSPDFESDKEDIHIRANEIALGATQDAARTHDRALIQVGQEAVTLLTTYLPADAQAAKIEEIQIVRRSSEAEILKNETLVGALTKIEGFVPEIDEDEPPVEGAPPPDPIPALVARRELLARYSDLESHRDVVAAMTRILEAERSLVTYTELNVDALTDDPHAAVPPSLSLVFNARSRLDAVSVGQCAFALSKDAIYGVDTVTGEPVWRRVIGFNSPFYPVEEPTVPSLIVFDTYQSELCRINRNTGELLWRQPITDDDVRSLPIVHEGQIILPTIGGSLYQIDLQTGRLIGRLTFSQEVTTPVALSDGKLVVAGNEEVAYTLTGRPFECVGVSYLGQQPGSITAPLLSMGPYVAMVEGVSENKSLLRLLSAANNELAEVARADIAGEVYDTPVIRGRDLFVPSTGERVSAYSVSDDSNQPPLTVGPTFQVQNGSDNPTFLLTGPDRQLWMTSSALLKLQLTSEALAAESGDLPIGEASQPLQYQSGVIFNGRRRAYSTAVTLAPVDRDEQTSEWQAQVGASLLAVSPAGSNLICLTEEGGVFRLTDMGWTSSGFGPEPSTRLPLNPELADPLLATDLGGGQIAVACGDPEPKLWIINTRGEIERSTLLESPLQAAPILLGNGIVLPMQGRLKYQPIRAGAAGVEDFTLPTDEALSSTWVQVVRLSDTSIAALTSAGDVLLVVLQSAPRAHLGEVSRFKLPASVTLPLQGDAQFLAVTDVNHNVQVFDTATLSPVAQRSFETAVWGAWSSGGMVFVQTDDGMLNLVSGDALTTSLQVPLNSVLVGPPTVTGETALVALQNGEVFTWDLQSGETRDFHWVGAALSQLPIQMGEELLFVTVDGSLIRLPAGSQVAAGAQTNN